MLSLLSCNLGLVCVFGNSLFNRRAYVPLKPFSIKFLHLF